MPPLPSVAGVVKVEFEGTNSSNYWANIIHYAYAGGPPSMTAVAGMAETASSAWIEAMSPLQAAATTFTNTTVTDLSSELGAQAEQPSTTAGTLAGGQLPAAVCALANYPAGVLYRGGHPKNFLYVGVEASLLNETHWTDDFAATVQSSWIGCIATMLEDFDGTNLTDFVWVSYTNKAAWESVEDNPLRPYLRTIPAVHVIDSDLTIVSTDLATQRRRQRRSR